MLPAWLQRDHTTHQNCWQQQCILCTGEVAPRGALVLWMPFLHGVTPPPLSSGCLQPGSEKVAIYLESQFTADKVHQCSVWLFNFAWLIAALSENIVTTQSATILRRLLGKWWELWCKPYTVETMANMKLLSRAIQSLNIVSSNLKYAPPHVVLDFMLIHLFCLDLTKQNI